MDDEHVHRSLCSMVIGKEPHWAQQQPSQASYKQYTAMVKPQKLCHLPALPLPLSALPVPNCQGQTKLRRSKAVVRASGEAEGATKQQGATGGGGDTLTVMTTAQAGA